MDITHSTPVPDGKLPVRLYAAGTAYAFARVYLSDSAGTALDVASTDDADRLILAGITAKTMLLGEAAEQLPPPTVQDMREIFFPDDPDGSKHGHFDAPSAASVAEGLPVLDDDGDDRDDAEIDARDAAEAAEPGGHFHAVSDAAAWSCQYAQPYATAKDAAEYAAALKANEGLTVTVVPCHQEPASPLAPPRGYTTPAVEVPAKDGTGPAWCGHESHDHTCCDGARAAFGVQA